jgi:hypothetical protein
MQIREKFVKTNSTNISRVFKLQKKVIRIISGVGPRDSCISLFKKLDILPLSCEYIFSLMLFVIIKINFAQVYLPTSNLSVFQKGTMFIGTRLFNRSLRTIRSLRKDRVLKIT